MTDEAQDMAVAIALGWTWTEAGWVDPSGKEWQVMHGWNTYKDGSEIIPRYGSDLNACHEMEKFLQGKPGYDRPKYKEWERQVYKLCKNPYSASAPQRREAFLRTLNLYTD
jgi:hypothetical protein